MVTEHNAQTVYKNLHNSNNVKTELHMEPKTK